MASPARSCVIHGHFYQPPREDPWLEVVGRQPSAAPFHDWNERIERECYRTVVAARVLDGEGRIENVLNALEWMSFDFGPTLLAWLERHAHDTYAAILRADARSCARLEGHGNAMAMAYHHPILPLSSPRARRAEIRWGIDDFRRRFGRAPEGMWLPETAVDEDTLDALAEAGIRFTVLAPTQVEAAPEGGLPGRWKGSGGRELALFVYDGDLSHGVAFGELLRDGVAWAERMAGTGAEDTRIVSLATDGETFGHHHRFAEMALAGAIQSLRSREGVRLESFASFLARNPPEEEVGLVAPSAWSCAHGVDRWQADCGCRANGEEGSSQAWRAPLREAVTWLADALHDRFDVEAADLLADPVEAREGYGAVVEATDPAARSAHLEAHLLPGAGPDGRIRAAELLELERNALRLFTSCAWFFDDVAGIEPRQVLRYAARAIELAGPDAARLEAGFRARLEEAESNDPEIGTAGRLWAEHVLDRVPVEAALAAAAANLDETSESGPPRWGAWSVEVGDGRVRLTQGTTGRTWQGRAHASGVAPSTFRATVEPEGGEDRIEIRWADLPPAVREILGDAWTAAALGFAPEPHVVESQLRLAIGGAAADLPADRPADAALVERIVRLVGALESRGGSPPFDPQTRVWLLWERGGEVAEGVVPLLEAMGFRVPASP